jgi:hypothetical protein
MTRDLPRCARCRVTIQVSQNVVFREDGRVQHPECPPVRCPVCGREVLPGEPIRRQDEWLIHANCWVRQERSNSRT